MSRLTTPTWPHCGVWGTWAKTTAQGAPSLPAEMLLTLTPGAGRDWETSRGPYSPPHKMGERGGQGLGDEQGSLQPSTQVWGRGEGRGWEMSRNLYSPPHQDLGWWAGAEHGHRCSYKLRRSIRRPLSAVSPIEALSSVSV